MKEDKGLFNLFTEKDTEMSRRLFLKTCGAAALLAGVPYNLSTVFAAEGNVPEHVTLTWRLDPATTQSIAWSTKTGVSDGGIQVVRAADYRKSGWTHAVAVAAAAEVFQSNTGDFLLHYATADNLKPGTSYVYRVGEGDTWSESYSFTTAEQQDKAFKFLVFGDSQSGLPKNPEYGPWRTTINNAYAANKDAAFFMNVGDLVEVGQDNAHWQKWYEAAKDVIAKIPSMAVPGNHETYDVPEENHSVRPQYFTKQLLLPENGPGQLKGQAYSFDYGNTHFAIIDSQEQEEGQYVPDMLAVEAAWLDQDLAATNKKWKIVLFHKTPYYNKAFRSNEKLKAMLTPVIDKHHVDLVINGHDHGYSRTYPIYRDTFVDSPDKGTVYLVAGRSGNKFYTDLSPKVWDAFFFDPQAEPNYIVIELSGDVLTIKGFTQSGGLIDEYRIDKAGKSDWPRTIAPERSNDTRLVIWGNMLQTPLVNTAPQQIAGVWHIPLRSFMEFIGGEIENSGGLITTRYQNVTASFTLQDKAATKNGAAVTLTQPLVLTKGSAMIAADDVKAIWGFNSRYDEKTNMLFVVK